MKRLAKDIWRRERLGEREGGDGKSGMEGIKEGGRRKTERSF